MQRATCWRLGGYLRACRQERRLSLRQVERLAAAFNEPIANSYLANCERGRFIPSVPKLLTLSRVYGVPVESFVDRIDLCRYEALKPSVDSHEACREMGIEAAQRGDLGRAFACFERALELLEREGGNIARRWASEIDIAIVLKRMGRHAAARETLERVLRQGGMPAALRVRSLDILAGVLREMGHLVLALLCAREANRLAIENGETRLAPHTWNTLGNVHFDMGDDVSALPCYEEAVRAFSAASETAGLTAAAANLGNCLARLGRREEAMGRLRQALELARRHDYRRHVADILGYMARLRYQEGRSAEARLLAHESNQIARRGDYFDTLFVNHFYLWRMAREEHRSAEEKILLKSLKYFRSKIESSFPELREFDLWMNARPGRPDPASLRERRFLDAIRKAPRRPRLRPDTVDLD
jgi:tetratricopeptide (TPR) repeat protein